MGYPWVILRVCVLDARIVTDPGPNTTPPLATSMHFSAHIGRYQNAFVHSHSQPLKNVTRHVRALHSSRVSQHSKPKSAAKPASVFPILVKATSDQPRPPPLSAVEKERIRSTHITVSYWESNFFEMHLFTRLHESLQRALRRDPTPEELDTAFKAVRLLRANPKAYIGYTPYANVVRDIAEFAEKSWSPELRREVREGGARLRSDIYSDRISMTILVAGAVGFTW